MIQLGWALVATDYTGLGTPGVQAYLLKDQEVTRHREQRTCTATKFPVQMLARATAYSDTRRVGTQPCGQAI